MASKTYGFVGKRILDVVVSATALVLLSPVLVVVMVLVRVNLGKPVFFKHSRPGQHGKPFDLYKFRTMTDERDANGNLLPDRDRITKFGAFLRTTSLDELPELFNILKGEMSLVGPRPLLVRYLPYYSAEEMQRFEVLPGLTGWAQVQGRNTVNWDTRLAQDVWYVQNSSFLLDLRILVKTLQIVFKREGIVVVPDSAMQSLDVERADRV